MLGKISAFDVRECQFVVGRQQEIALFSRFLDNRMSGGGIWNLYGTGGVGKSTLLQVYRLLAHQQGACYLLLDSRDFSHTGHDLLKALYMQMKGVPPESDPQSLLEIVLDEIQELARDRKVILALDTFEEMSGLEAWLRDRFFKWLPEQMLVLIAGRQPLKGPWLHSPVWRERIVRMPVEHLNREAAFDYLRRCGVTEEERMVRMWHHSMGHPLALSLTVATQWAPDQTLREDGMNWFDDIAALWLKEVPHKDLRRIVEAASVLRQFNQEMLSYLLEEDINASLFESLTALSFVQPSERGWKMHDVMREATCGLLRERMPKLYRSLMERCAFYYAEAILHKSRKADVSWEVVELFYYVEDYSLRAMKHMAAREKYYWEPLTDSTIMDAEAYVRDRLRTRKSTSLKKIDPESGLEIQIDLSAQESTYMIQDIDLAAFYKMDSRSVQLLRSEEGQAVAIAVLVPLHSGTIPRLSHDPVFGPFLANLAPSDRKALETPPDRPAGWFIRSLDYGDPTDPTYIAEGMKLTNAYMCSRGILVISPQPVEAVKQVFLSLGFEQVPGASHCHYDGTTPTPYFIIDTREDGLRDFLVRLLSQSGMNWSPSEEASSPKSGQESRWTSWNLTAREQQVAELVVEGHSNPEIAHRLQVSEMTVKKHMSGILGKAGVKNRVQLIRRIIGQA
ncbi:LuxR family transcriptional regulator [Paenibacillus rigui]|uniref:LuxR family transcriptional regulator n=1 Tax=Paenibacillus rigui TaxID=554312 RepID=A0A229UH26_9BACL|nr:LuxR family transcriptional regulator [Paenibacillus rigui]